jgi:hypothetical protein
MCYYRNRLAINDMYLNFPEQQSRLAYHGHHLRIHVSQLLVALVFETNSLLIHAFRC